jgi:uncharacterized protein YdeI (YjbR/CyaY-like superfamily)
VRTRQQWRNWLRKHHDSESGIWLVCQKRRTAEKSISCDGAVEEALCFGWIDSIVNRLDEDRYLRKFTPRKPESRWSTINCHRLAKLKASGSLAAPGLERAPMERSGDAPRPSVSVIPFYIENQLKASARARDYFEQLAPSYRRAYIGWIDSAKREETKEKRLREAVSLLADGKKLGLKWEEATSRHRNPSATARPQPCVESIGHGSTASSKTLH